MNKKAMAVLTAAGIIPAMIGNVSSFAFAENSDVLHLQNVILGIEEPEKADDINADGKVDVCDLCMLKEKKQSSEEFKKMYIDLTYGLELDVVFDRLSNRIKLDETKYMASSLVILNKTGGNIVKVFSSIERSFFEFPTI